VSFVAIALCVASQRVFIVVSVYFVIDSVRKRLDTPSYVIDIDIRMRWCRTRNWTPNVRRIAILRNRICEG